VPVWWMRMARMSAGTSRVGLMSRAGMVPGILAGFDRNHQFDRPVG